MGRNSKEHASKGKSESTCSQERTNDASQSKANRSTALLHGLHRLSRLCWHFLKYLLGVYLYLFWLWNVQRSALWYFAYKWDTRCQHEPLPVNQTGLKVLIAGFAKTGTWAMTVQLRSIGLRNTWHSEEFLGHIWTHLAHEFWWRPENGRTVPRGIHPLNVGWLAWEESVLTGVEAPVPDIHREDDGDEGIPANSSHFPDHDLKVLADLKLENLASSMSRCRVDSLAMDGLEALYYPIYNMSPNVKVILLDWRPYNSWRRSLESFGFWWLLLTIPSSNLWAGAHGLPWGYLLALIDPWIGGRIDEFLRRGEPFLQLDYDIPLMFWTPLVFQLRVFTHWFGGLAWLRVPEDEYHAFYAELRRRTPPENLLRWNPKHGTYEELCEFLNVADCPMSGMPERIITINNWEKIPFGETTEPLMLAPFFVFFHFVNWKVYTAILKLAGHLCRASCRCCRRKAVD